MFKPLSGRRRRPPVVARSGMEESMVDEVQIVIDLEDGDHHPQQHVVVNVEQQKTPPSSPQPKTSQQQIQPKHQAQPQPKTPQQPQSQSQSQSHPQTPRDNRTPNKSASATKHNVPGGTLKRQTTDEFVKMFDQLEIINASPDINANNNANNNAKATILTSPNSDIIVGEDDQQPEIDNDNEDDDDEDEDDEEGGDPNAVVELGKDAEEDDEEDPDPVDFTQDDLFDSNKFVGLHEQVRQRNSRQRYQREQRMNEMFDKITGGAPPPYITPTKFQKFRKRETPSEPFGGIDDPELREQMMSLTSSLSINMLAPPQSFANPLSSMSNPPTTTTTTTTSAAPSSSLAVTPSKPQGNGQVLGGKRKQPPTPGSLVKGPVPFSGHNQHHHQHQSPIKLNLSSSVNGDSSIGPGSINGSSPGGANNNNNGHKIRKLFPSKVNIHTKLREVITGVCVLEAKQLVSVPDLPLLIVALIRLSLFSTPIFKSTPNNEEGKQFSEMLNKNQLVDIAKTLKMEASVKIYCQTTEDQWLGSKIHKKKAMNDIQLMRQLLKIIISAPNTLLHTLATLPMTLKSITLDKDITAVLEYVREKQPIVGQSAEQMAQIKRILDASSKAISSPGDNILWDRFNDEFLPIITSRNEFDAKMKSILKSGDSAGGASGQAKPKDKDNVVSLPQPSTVQPHQQPLAQPPQSFKAPTSASSPSPIIFPSATTKPTTQSSTSATQPTPASSATTTTTATATATGTTSTATTTTTTILSAKSQSKAMQEKSQEYVQQVQLSLKDMTSDEVRIQHLLGLLQKQNQQIQQTQFEKERLVANNQSLFQNLERYVAWHNSLKMKWDEYASFMCNAMLFNLQQQQQSQHKR
ncbi:hypothetical protein SAMD00019534_090220 [Acytostelium subglobosum LB1]|uniref:hypothetical protein n=1 Tax=Acytostelium subglobosum LB1 TaxID=1410327 RepID=UPI00064500A9|nr:hypothetical protein SAMD00019534_090220 [Acytostelium subglobosum LB1]GAM25847.1 hypothetical protein SAMD00019534_090220 [Acytostelium subglobosum LB1]|eukprot:XP_012751365.1 hypothetical protein SAMD00019534_090220 [Acytostelium subglobosum LB1]